ncbi:hypothetical protein Trydic_g22875 [Trypoxylus dichotomus]
MQDIDYKEGKGSDSITNLFKHCLRTSYFVWDGSFYEQTDGVAMDSPLSPVVANLFMEQFESLAIETAVDKPTVWWRYVEDTFVICPYGRDKLDRFLEHLNGAHPNIQFTMDITIYLSNEDYRSEREKIVDLETMSEPSNSPPETQECTIGYRLQHPCSILAITDLNTRGAVVRQIIARTES